VIVHQGVYLPDGETHLTAWMDKAGEIVDGRGTYQIAKLRKALSFCRGFRTAVDVGAHCGLWSMQLVKQFSSLYAFEPVEAHRECFCHNLPGLTAKWVIDDNEDRMAGASGSVGACRVDMYAYALGEQHGSIRIETAPTSSGDSRIGGPGDIPMHTLDSFALSEVDFIKIDTEGYELPILRGAAETIKRDMPVIIVEQKPGHAQHFGFRETEAVDYLLGLGYKTAAVMSGDYVMVPG